LKKVRHPNII
jgi:5'-AMP-activated protein kinase catalytic alpha subunit